MFEPQMFNVVFGLKLLKVDRNVFKRTSTYIAGIYGNWWKCNFFFGVSTK